MPHVQLYEQLQSEQETLQIEALHLLQDALQISLGNAVTLLVYAASSSEYSFDWQWGDIGMRIDTAPLHATLATSPNHLHRADGTVVADPITDPGQPLFDNCCKLIRHLQRNPLLDAG